MSAAITLPAVLPLSRRAIFRLTGGDRLRYLNGQITQDVRLASAEKAVYSTITNAKGKIEGDAYVRLYHESILVDCPAELREAMLARIDRYIIADDVELEDVSDDYQLAHVLGESSSHPDTLGQWQCDRFGTAGTDILLPASAETPAATHSQNDWEKLRITNSIPVWGKELDDSVMPPEANLDARAVSFNKGCYIGQEVISRIRSAGKTNRHLVQLTLSEEVAEGTALLCEGASEEKTAGTITSIVEIDGTWTALAYRKRKFAEQSTFTCGAATATITE